MDRTLIPLPQRAVRVRNYSGRIILGLGNDSVELSESAEIMWRNLSPDRDLTDLMETLAHAYSVSADDVADDVVEWVSEMSAAGFLDLRSPGPSIGSQR